MTLRCFSSLLLSTSFYYVINMSAMTSKFHIKCRKMENEIINIKVGKIE